MLESDGKNVSCRDSMLYTKKQVYEASGNNILLYSSNVS